MNEHLQELKVGGRPKRKWEIELEEKDKEIERLNKELTFERQIKKEVREYITNKVISNGEVIDQLRKIEVKELLEILDKVGDIK